MKFAQISFIYCNSKHELHITEYYYDFLRPNSQRVGILVVSTWHGMNQYGAFSLESEGVVEKGSSAWFARMRYYSGACFLFRPFVDKRNK